MNETIDYIEAYFDNSLTAEERMRFEQRITTDAAFAGEVAFYIQARQALRQELLWEKEKNWQQEPVVATSPVVSIAPVGEKRPVYTGESSANDTQQSPVVKMGRPAWVRRVTAVAASIAVAAGISVPLFLNNLQRMTAGIVEDKVAHYDGEMGEARKDRMAEAKAYFSKADYKAAAPIFDSLQAVQPGNTEALEFSGRTALLLENYDSAISLFQRLAAHPGKSQQSNPGKFFQALAVIRSRQDGYKDEAKELLITVRDNKLEGAEEAKELLEKL